jgi:23S rRNA (cytidine1920-2'-O)/16S rRNA (cytidine1409-2'-O)-methyltransferase
MSKQRVDSLLVEKGFVESRSLAQRLVMAGKVRANGQLVHKPSSMLATDVSLEIESPPKYVSRGGLKLEAAIEAFKPNVVEAICADVGSSTGGFTDCLLQSGAKKVYAIDVGRGQLHWNLRNDPRVISMEKTNARYLKELPESVSLVTIDASFISLEKLLPAVKQWLSPDGEIIALVKPQFEVGKQEAKKAKGVIQDPILHQEVLNKILHTAEKISLRALGLIPSPITGPKGNVEFLVLLKESDLPESRIKELVSSAVGITIN